MKNWFGWMFWGLSWIFFAGACTTNARAKNFGGTAKYCLDPGDKLVTVTWKEGDLWLLTRPAREDEYPETLKFQEQSSFGVWNGTVVIEERLAGDKSACK